MAQKPDKYDKRLYSVSDYEAVANTRFFRHAHDYFNSGANDEVSLRQQYDAFKDIKLKQRTFVDASQWKGMDTDIMGKPIKSPICITSTAFQRMAHPEGECATARACEKMNNTPVVMSSWATTANEEFGQNAPNTTKVFQIYLSKIPEVNIDIWNRVKRSGFSALAMTTDTQLLGKRLNDTRTKFSLPYHLKMQNFAKYMEQGQQAAVKGGKESGLAEFVKNSKDNQIDWSIV
jgi:(S)-2-hydroxy-acid oxidase